MGARPSWGLKVRGATGEGSVEEISQQPGADGAAWNGTDSGLSSGIGQSPPHTPREVAICQQAVAASKGCAKKAATTTTAASFVVELKPSTSP